MNLPSAGPFFLPPPFQRVPYPNLLYIGASWLAMGAVGAYALITNSWSLARGYLAIAGLFVALDVVASIVVFTIPPGPPVILVVYVLLGLLYLPLVVWVWRQQEKQAK